MKIRNLKSEGRRPKSSPGVARTNAGREQPRNTRNTRNTRNRVPYRLGFPCIPRIPRFKIAAKMAAILWGRSEGNPKSEITTWRSQNQRGKRATAEYAEQGPLSSWVSAYCAYSAVQDRSHLGFNFTRTKRRLRSQGHRALALHSILRPQALPCHAAAAPNRGPDAAFGSRISIFGFPSDFGLRISDFGTAALTPTQPRPAYG